MTVFIADVKLENFLSLNEQVENPFDFNGGKTHVFEDNLHNSRIVPDNSFDYPLVISFWLILSQKYALREIIDCYFVVYFNQFVDQSARRLTLKVEGIHIENTSIC